MLLPQGCLHASQSSVGGQRVGGNQLQIGFVVLQGILVISLSVLHLSQIEDGHSVGVMVSDGILICSGSLGGIVDVPVAFRHFPSSFCSLGLVLDGRA